MQWLLSAAYQLLSESLIDFVFFVLVDAVAKSPLREARSEAEKRTIWLYESLVLAAVCVLIYILDHTPYICLTLTVATLLYTQLLGRVDFRYWWRYMFERWEEHQHHSENVQLINKKQKQMEMWQKLRVPTPVSKPVLTRLSDFITRKSDKKENPPPTPIFAMNKMFIPTYPVPEVQMGMLNNPQQNTMVNRPAVSDPNLELKPNPSVHVPDQQSMQTGLLRTQVMPSSPVYSTATPPPVTTDSPSLRPVNNWFTKNDLKRRPLRSHETRDPAQYSFSTTRSNIRQRFMSAFGFSEKNDKPAGLRNDGQNLCFMNCVLQCLSHSPGLVDKLYVESNQELDCSDAESTMIGALSEIMTQCRRTKNEGVLDPTLFREAVSMLNGGLVSPLTERQHQQDAAEFFMWLMETLHRALNKKSISGNTFEKGSSMEMLKFIYGDLTPDRIRDLKEACRREIEEANGLKNDSYAEPIQRLSDFEWLTYKKSNHSVVDELFTGQLVEAYHCLVDNHITVNTQTFNILPVPIVPPRNLSGLVHLEDCFTKFCNIEHLVGQEGFQCSHCIKNSNTQQSPAAPVRHVNQRTTRATAKSKTNSQGSVDSAFHSTVLSTSSCMSPIPREGLNDSGFHDNVFRTSTPVSGETQRFVFPSRHIRETERRCLLRQLPQCLVIQPLRFSFNQFTRQSRKICSAISIPLKGLDLTSIVYDNVTNRDDMTASQKSQKYDLYGVCVHLGAESTNYGHYICYCLAENGVWYKFDDELVWEVNIEYEITTREIRENAYLLFYRRAQEKS